MSQEIPCLSLTLLPHVPRGWGELRMETKGHGSLVACPTVELRVGHAMEVLIRALERRVVWYTCPALAHQRPSGVSELLGKPSITLILGHLFLRSASQPEAGRPLPGTLSPPWDYLCLLCIYF